MKIKTQIMESIKGLNVDKITLINDKGIEIGLLTLGATWQEFLVPDVAGGKKNLIIGFDKPSTYLTDTLCAGQSIGRVAGRINAGRFILDGAEYQLPQNEKGNCLHGGPKGFHRQIWDYQLEETADAATARFTYQVEEAIDGFPGDMKVEACFTLDNNNRLTITYTGSDATQTTLFNPTNHVYFNLSKRQDLATHTLTLASSHYLETRPDLIPTGQLLEVANTSYDFRSGQNLGEAIAATGGLDDSFVVEPSLTEAIGILKDEESEDQIKIYSDRNAWVAYTMGGIPSDIYPSRDNGKAAKEFEAIALEAQFLPDAINHDGFGDTRLFSGESKTYTIAFEYNGKQS